MSMHPSICLCIHVLVSEHLSWKMKVIGKFLVITYNWTRTPHENVNATFVSSGLSLRCGKSSAVNTPMLGPENNQITSAKSATTNIDD